MNDASNSENPFEAPQPAQENPFSEAPAETSAPESLKERKFRDIGRLFLAWERLRAFYNLALVVMVVPLAILLLLQSEDPLATGGDIIGVCIAGCIGANFCFLLGHYLTAWLVMFGVRGKVAMVILFWCGVGISIPIALLSVLSVAMN